MTTPRTPRSGTAKAGPRTAKAVGKTSRRTSKVLARRPRRALRVVIMMCEEEQGQLITLCEEDVRPISSWFRIVVRRAWQARKPAKKAQRFQRGEEDGQTRHVEVWTRLSEEERDQLDVLAGEADVSIAVWFRRRLRESWAEYQEAQAKLRRPKTRTAPKRAR